MPLSLSPHQSISALILHQLRAVCARKQNALHPNITLPATLLDVRSRLTRNGSTKTRFQKQKRNMSRNSRIAPQARQVPPHPLGQTIKAWSFRCATEVRGATTSDQIYSLQTGLRRGRHYTLNPRRRASSGKKNKPNERENISQKKKPNEREHLTKKTEWGKRAHVVNGREDATISIARQMHSRTRHLRKKNPHKPLPAPIQ